MLRAVEDQLEKPLAALSLIFSLSGWPLGIDCLDLLAHVGDRVRRDPDILQQIHVVPFSVHLAQLQPVDWLSALGDHILPSCRTLLEEGLLHMQLVSFIKLVFYKEAVRVLEAFSQQLLSLGVGCSTNRQGWSAGRALVNLVEAVGKRPAVLVGLPRRDIEQPSFKLFPGLAWCTVMWRAQVFDLDRGHDG